MCYYRIDVTCPSPHLRHDNWLLRVNCHGFDFLDRNNIAASVTERPISSFTYVNYIIK